MVYGKLWFIIPYVGFGTMLVRNRKCDIEQKQHHSARSFLFLIEFCYVIICPVSHT